MTPGSSCAQLRETIAFFLTGGLQFLAGFKSPARYSPVKAVRRAGSRPAAAGRRVKPAPGGARTR